MIERAGVSHMQFFCRREAFDQHWHEIFLVLSLCEIGVYAAVGGMECHLRDERIAEHAVRKISAKSALRLNKVDGCFVA